MRPVGVESTENAVTSDAFPIPIHRIMPHERAHSFRCPARLFTDSDRPVRLLELVVFPLSKIPGGSALLALSALYQGYRGQAVDPAWKARLSRGEEVHQPEPCWYRNQ